MNCLSCRSDVPRNVSHGKISVAAKSSQRMFHGGHVTRGVTTTQAESVTPDVTKLVQGFGKLRSMKRTPYPVTYLREWREFRNLSLRKLAARMEWEPGVQLISHAQLQRIEVGEQPYSQPILEAAAVALNTTAAAIIDVNPQKEHEVIDLLKFLKGAKRVQAIEYLAFLAKR